MNILNPKRNTIEERARDPKKVRGYMSSEIQISLENKIKLDKFLKGIRLPARLDGKKIDFAKTLNELRYGK